MEISQIYVSVDDVREHLNEWMGVTPQKLVGLTAFRRAFWKNVANKSPQAFSRFLTSHLAVVKFLPRRNPQTWQLFTRKTKKKLVKNYRPISLLQIVCKVLEQCAFNRFLSSLMTQSPLYNTQLLPVLHTMRQKPWQKHPDGRVLFGFCEGIWHRLPP